MVRDGLKVRRIDAELVLTHMVNVAAARYRPLGMDVSKFVRTGHRPGARLAIPEDYLSVTVMAVPRVEASGAGPIPATGFWVSGEFGEKPCR